MLPRPAATADGTPSRMSFSAARNRRPERPLSARFRFANASARGLTSKAKHGAWPPTATALWPEPVARSATVSAQWSRPRRRTWRNSAELSSGNGNTRTRRSTQIPSVTKMRPSSPLILTRRVPSRAKPARARTSRPASSASTKGLASARPSVSHA